MLLSALLLLATPAQTAAPQPAPSLGDPRRRGGARDLFEEDDGDDPAVRLTAAFALRPTGVEHIGPLAVTDTGRYAAYGLSRTDRPTRVVVVDTASASVRAVGPTLGTPPEGLALSAERLFIAAQDQLVEQPWFAAESAARAFAAPSAEVIRTPLPPGGRTHTLLTSDKAGLVALLRQHEGRWSLHTRPLASGELSTIDLDDEPGARCTGMTFAAEGLLLVVACQHEGDAFALRVPTDGGKVQRVALSPADRDATLTAVSALGSLTITGWDSGGRGAVFLHGADGRAQKRVDTDRPPRALHAVGNSAVVVEHDGSVWLVGLGTGATRLGVESPELGDRGVAQAQPVIATDGGTVVLADDGAGGARPTLWVVPAIQ
jgi:hypothetical protein